MARDPPDRGYCGSSRVVDARHGCRPDRRRRDHRGFEHDGVSGEWLQRADQSARLPMLGHLNSLNVSATAAIVIYEALRQRRLGGITKRFG
ncbi:MAG: TrmH family RNA methyltransferase [Nocardioidaceae bacterium]